MPATPRRSLTTGDTERPGLLTYIPGLRFITFELFDAAALTTTGLLHVGHS
ncbi:hypothetical protein [Streptomyces sp. NPDC056045]|uniref:hypothetical protein n=1 Tax=Streptomyces sp. NPDC056045 TaxID=3345691 RepID=UPI0035D74EF8